MSAGCRMEYSVIIKGILTGNYDEGELCGKTWMS